MAYKEFSLGSALVEVVVSSVLWEDEDDGKVVLHLT
jgi:hypothetical protein